MVVGAGEIFGGGIAPIIAGNVAQAYGIQAILWVALFGVTLGIFVSLFLKETAPRKIGVPAPQAAAGGHRYSAKQATETLRGQWPRTTASALVRRVFRDAVSQRHRENHALCLRVSVVRDRQRL